MAEPRNFAGEIRHAEQLNDYAAASYLLRLVCRLGGCGPAVVMRTGSHLGGGPAPLGPAPTLPVKPLRARLRPPPAPAGVSSCRVRHGRRGCGEECTRVGARCGCVVVCAWGVQVVCA